MWAINEGRQCAEAVERYFDGLDYHEPIHSGNVEPADEGPEGPPQHVNYGIQAEGAARGDVQAGRVPGADVQDGRVQAQRASTG